MISLVGCTGQYREEITWDKRPIDCVTVSKGRLALTIIHPLVAQFKAVLRWQRSAFGYLWVSGKTGKHPIKLYQIDGVYNVKVNGSKRAWAGNVGRVRVEGRQREREIKRRREIKRGRDSECDWCLRNAGLALLRSTVHVLRSRGRFNVSPSGQRLSLRH